MALRNHPIWPFEPNWKSTVSETLEWLTRVLTSPTGAEQRAAIRLFPRRTVEFSTVLEGYGRTLFDNMLASYGGSNWYLPTWHDVNIVNAPVSVGATSIPTETALTSALVAGGAAFIVNEDALTYELVEVVATDAGGVTIAAPGTALAWPAGSRLYPCTIARLTDQPNLTKRSDTVAETSVRFNIAERTVDPGEVIADAGPLIVNGLVTNAYHQETGRGGYFHHNSGTSEGQFIVIYSLYLAYEQLIGGNQSERTAADYYRTLAESMLDAIGNGGLDGPMLRQPVPTDPDTITLMHWLFAGRGDIPGQKVIYAYEVRPNANRKLVIPSNASGHRTFKVWAIYPGTSELLFNSPFSPAFDITNPAAATEIAIKEDDWQIVGTDCVITLPANAGTHRTWKVLYGFHTDSIIPIAKGFEAYPNWTQIDPGYSACAPDTFRWFDQSMNMAIQHDTRPGNATKWRNLRDAMRRTAVKGQAITDLREVIRPMPGFAPIPVKGNPDGMFCYSNHPDAKSPSATGANPGWKGYDFWSRAANGDIIGRIPAAPKVNQVQIGRGFSDEWRTATNYQDADQYLYVSVSASKRPAADELFAIFISGTMSYDENQRWYADIGSLPEFVATTGDVIEFYLPRSAFKLRSWGAQGQNIWGTALPAGQHIENFGVTSEMAGAYQIRIREMRLVSGQSAAWVLANKEIAKKGSKMPFFPGALPFAINADTRNQQFVGWNGSPFHGYQLADFWWWLGDDAEIVHPNLTVEDLPIPHRQTGELTFPLEPLTLNGVSKPKHALLMEQQLMFLRHAQEQYADDGGPVGFFAHTFVINTPARSSLGNPTPHTWVYVNDDPNTRWVGYQTRLVESLAELCLLAKDHSGFDTAVGIAAEMLGMWLNQLNNVWPNLAGKVVDGERIYGMPTDYPDPRISGPQTLYEEPHAAAHIMRACITMRRAFPSSGNDWLYSTLITRCWNYLEMLWRTSGEMRHTWSPDPDNKQWYGFWHGDIISTLALAIANPSALPAAVAAAIPVMRQRLVETQGWLAETGVGFTRPDPATGISDVYRDNYVLTTPPNDRENLTAQFQRMMENLDNGVGIPEHYDTAKRSFSLQKFTWLLEGRAEHLRFKALLGALRGRAQPFWMPTFMADFELLQPVNSGDTTLVVKLCGFTHAGGPRPDYEDIVIDLGHTRLYRRITASALGSDGTEVLGLDMPIRTAISPGEVERFCFVRRMRLDQDAIEFTYETDNQGVSQVSANIRSAPDNRVPEAAFYIE